MEPRGYRIEVNRNLSPLDRYTTPAHELGHLFCGHLGPDQQVPDSVALDFPFKAAGLIIRRTSALLRRSTPAPREARTPSRPCRGRSRSPHPPYGCWL
ncbi:ImmA/IrrE family metallo-endopeptidase [Streptomyces sp. 1268]|uniref:ImmA/IrrE family metallo-endopeptidase n=1 Tax=Streptomyces sp. 1268 TaxID=3231942 RepID=UPI0038D43D6F